MIQEEVFSQEIPEYQQSEKIRGPPVLPPHLLQVILNKDTPISVRVMYIGRTKAGSEMWVVDVGMGKCDKGLCDKGLQVIT